MCKAIKWISRAAIIMIAVAAIGAATCAPSVIDAFVKNIAIDGAVNDFINDFAKAAGEGKTMYDLIWIRNKKSEISGTVMSILVIDISKLCAYGIWIWSFWCTAVSPQDDLAEAIGKLYDMSENCNGIVISVSVIIGPQNVYVVIGTPR